MDIKAIIFDLDGVICHTDKYHYLAWKSIADELGIYFDEEINNRLRGVSRLDSFDIILEKYNGEMSHFDKIKWTDIKNDRYREFLNEMTPQDLDNEVLETLNKLKESGLKLAIGSSSKNAPLILKRLNLDGFFHGISDGNNIKNSKPDPEVFLLAAQYINIPPENCAVVEDAIAGLEACKRANMYAVSIGDVAVESGLGDFNLNSFSDLMNLVSK